MNGPIKQRGTYLNSLSIGIASYDATFLQQTNPSVSIHSFFIKGFLECVWISMIERKQANFILNEAKNIDDASASTRLFNKIQEKIFSFQPIDRISNRLCSLNIYVYNKLYRSVVTGECFKILTKCIALIRILQFFVLSSLGKKSKHLQTKSSTFAVKQSPISSFIFVPSTSKKSVNHLNLFRMITKYNSVKGTPVIADAIFLKHNF